MLVTAEMVGNSLAAGQRLRYNPIDDAIDEILREELQKWLENKQIEESLDE